MYTVSKLQCHTVILCQKSVFVKKKFQTFQNRERRLKIEELWKSKNLLIDVAFWRENCYSLSYHNIWIQAQCCRFEKVLIKSKVQLWKLLTFWCFIRSLDLNGQVDTPLKVWHLSYGFLEPPKNLHLLHKKGYFGKLPCPPLPNSVYMAIKSVPTIGMIGLVIQGLQVRVLLEGDFFFCLFLFSYYKSFKK